MMLHILVVKIIEYYHLNAFLETQLLLLKIILFYHSISIKPFAQCSVRLVFLQTEQFSLFISMYIICLDNKMGAVTVEK